MKKSGLFIPLLLAGIVLILVIANALNHNVFKRTPAETLQLARDNKHFMGPVALGSIPADQLLVINIGKGKLPTFPSSVEVKSIDFSQLLSRETRALLSENKKRKILFAQNITDAVKAWTFLTRMGYNELFIYDPDFKTQTGQNDSIQLGNEELRYSFTPEKIETK